MQFEVAHRIDAFDAARWDSVAGDDVGLSHRWQRVMEAGRRDYHPLYCLVEDGRGPLAAVVGNRADRFGRRGWRESLLRRLTLVLSAPESPGSAASEQSRMVVIHRPTKRAALASYMPMLNMGICASGAARRATELTLTQPV